MPNLIQQIPVFHVAPQKHGNHKITWNSETKLFSLCFVWFKFWIIHNVIPLRNKFSSEQTHLMIYICRKYVLLNQLGLINDLVRLFKRPGWSQHHVAGWLQIYTLLIMWKRFNKLILQQKGERGIISLSIYECTVLCIKNPSSFIIITFSANGMIPNKNSIITFVLWNQFFALLSVAEH